MKNKPPYINYSPTFKALTAFLIQDEKLLCAPINKFGEIAEDELGVWGYIGETVEDYDLLKAINEHFDTRFIINNFILDNYEVSEEEYQDYFENE